MEIDDKLSSVFTDRNRTLLPKQIEQGKTIECLTFVYEELDASCQLQIRRVSELQSQDYHLDRAFYFACRNDRERVCPDVVSGEGRVYRCLFLNKNSVSEDCRRQITRRQKIHANNIQTDRAFMTACQRAIDANGCFRRLMFKGTAYAQPEMFLSNVLLCLENVVKNAGYVEDTCQAEMTDYRKMLVSDYRLSPQVVEFCSEEIAERCGGGVERAGKTLECLVAGARKAEIEGDRSFGSECLEEMAVFVKMVGVSEDLRVDPVFYEACLEVAERFCGFGENR